MSARYCLRLAVSACLAASAAACSPPSEADQISKYKVIVEEEIRQKGGEHAVTLKTFKEALPEAWELLLTGIARERVKTGNWDTGAQAVAGLVNAELRKNPSWLLNAPTEDMGRLIDANVTILRLLEKEDVEACKTFIDTGWLGDRPLSPQAVDAWHKQQRSVFRAIAAGRHTPQIRPKVSPMQKKQVEDSLGKLGRKHGLTPSDAEPKACLVSLLVFEGLSQLPPDLAAAWYAEAHIAALTGSGQVESKPNSDAR